MKHIRFLIVFLLLAFFSSQVFGACIKSRHVIGTSGSSELCQQQFKFALQKKQDTFEDQQAQYRRERELSKQKKADTIIERQENTGQSGNTGTILNLGGMFGSSTKEESLAEHGMAITKHELSVEWSGYNFPNAYGLERQPINPVLVPSGASYTYNISKNFGVSFIYEQFTLVGSMAFEPIRLEREMEETVTVLDASGDEQEATRLVTRMVPIHFPNIDRIEYQRIFYAVSFNSGIGYTNWYVGLKFGSGYARAKVVYEEINLEKEENKYGKQPGTQELQAERPWFADISIERWFEGTKVAGVIRFVEASNSTENYLEFVRFGGAQLILKVTFGIPGLGYL